LMNSPSVDSPCNGLSTEGEFIRGLLIRYTRQKIEISFHPYIYPSTVLSTYIPEQEDKIWDWIDKKKMEIDEG
ncbi:MAG: hypothetical protein AAF740_00655, partial [Bacteroidota bacterium]